MFVAVGRMFHASHALSIKMLDDDWLVCIVTPWLWAFLAFLKLTPVHHCQLWGSGVRCCYCCHVGRICKPWARVAGASAVVVAVLQKALDLFRPTLPAVAETTVLLAVPPAVLQAAGDVTTAHHAGRVLLGGGYIGSSGAPLPKGCVHVV